MKKVAVLLMFVVGSLFMSAQVEDDDGGRTGLEEPSCYNCYEELRWRFVFVGGVLPVWQSYLVTVCDPC